MFTKWEFNSIIGPASVLHVPASGGLVGKILHGGWFFTWITASSRFLYCCERFVVLPYQGRRLKYYCAQCVRISSPFCWHKSVFRAKVANKTNVPTGRLSAGSRDYISWLAKMLGNIICQSAASCCWVMMNLFRPELLSAAPTLREVLSPLKPLWIVHIVPRSATALKLLTGEVDNIDYLVTMALVMLCRIY